MMRLEAGVVDEYVQPAKFRACAREHLINLLFIRYVSLRGDSTTTRPRDLINHILSRFRFVEIVDDDTCALACKPQRDGASNAAVCAGHECAPTAQALRHFLPLVRVCRHNPVSCLTLQGSMAMRRTFVSG